MQNAKINFVLIANQNAGIRVIFHGEFSFREPYNKICFFTPFFTEKVFIDFFFF